MAELRPLAEARVRAARRQAASASGIGAAIWERIARERDGVTIRLVVTDGSGRFPAIDVFVPSSWRGVDPRLVEGEVERLAAGHPRGELLILGERDLRAA